jgi:hypothetical protein
MRFTHITTVACLLSLSLAATDGRAGEKIGPKLGTKAPAFTLKDHFGKERPLDEFLKKDKVALVFYRSASW